LYVFDQFNSEHRQPQGAIADNETLSLHLLLSRSAWTAAFIGYAHDRCGAVEIPLEFETTRGAFDVLKGTICPDGADLYWFWFRIETPDGVKFIDSEGLSEATGAPFQLTVFERGTSTPDWAKGGVMYQVFVDRFFHGDYPTVLRKDAVFREDWGGIPTYAPDKEGIVHNKDFFGGNLRGIIEKLPYFEELGVSILYLSPCFEAASNHKYDTANYMKIDPSFGDETVFSELCFEANKRGIRVILDGVFNHVGADSVYFNKYGNYGEQGAYQSKDSRYYPWFKFNTWPEEYETWWGIQILPATDKSSADFIRYITGEDGVTGYWMEHGLSGWRFDVVDELPDSFLDPLCRSIKKKNSDALIIGEVWEDASNKIAYDNRRRYFLGGQLDSVMNYPLKDAIIDYVKNGNSADIALTVERQCQNYPKQVLDCLMNIIGTHDTMRILTVLGGENFPDTKAAMSVYHLSPGQLSKGKQLLKLAAALQFTLPGFPCVYYGDEAGMEGGADPFNRVCYPWGGEDRELLDWYRKLSRIRKSLSAFKEGQYHTHCALGEIFSFTRGTGDETVLIAANVSGDPGTVPGNREFTYDLLNERYIDRLDIPPLGVIICANKQLNSGKEV
jgi:glycosidase